MPPELSQSGTPGDWLRYARSDLAYAQIPLPDYALPSIPCFHAQQATEKSIKAVLIHYGIEFPRTHNIRTLLDLLPSNCPVTSAVSLSAQLTDYAVSGRYA